jgi:hypothetical protein
MRSCGKGLATDSHRAMMLEKGTVAIMTTTLFLQKARRALVPMRKAVVDALLLTAFILIGLLVFTGILFTSPWLLLPIYTLAYLLAVVLRLRKAARETTAGAHQEQSLEGAHQELSSTKTLIGVGLYWGNHGR